MTKRKALSRGEMEVVRVLWSLQEATVRQVFEALSPDRDWDFTTVQTYLARLEEKGYLKHRKDGRSKVYSARIRPSKVIGEAVEDFLGSLFGGEALPLLRHLIADRNVSQEQLDELSSLIDETREAESEDPARRNNRKR